MVEGLDVFDIDTWTKLETKRKDLQSTNETQQSKLNDISKEIGLAKKDGKDISSLQDKASNLTQEIKEQTKILDELLRAIEEFTLSIPNLIDIDVPDGKDETDNLEIRKHGSPKEFTFIVKDHLEIADKEIDMEAGVKITGSRFKVFKNEIAQLQRALISFMVDTHVSENGYEEVYVPYIVNKDSLLGTGQLPKFEEDLFKVSDEGLYLIPTAEVPVSNIYRNKILNSDELPIAYVAHTPCFRSEAGSYGKDTKGIIRQHQFDKVELVKFVHPEDSEAELDKLTTDAENILNNLNLPYRKIILCSGDTGFASSKTFDLEVWFPSQKTYREISSCSNFRDFQSRRMKIRIKQSKENILCHTINGSGLAVGRTLAAILENNQTEQGSVVIPDVLVDYMGGTKELNLSR